MAFGPHALSQQQNANQDTGLLFFSILGIEPPALHTLEQRKYSRMGLHSQPSSYLLLPPPKQSLALNLLCLAQANLELWIFLLLSPKDLGFQACRNHQAHLRVGKFWLWIRKWKRGWVSYVNAHITPGTTEAK